MAHDALFAARHDEGLDLRVPDVVSGVLDRSGLPGDKVLADVESGAPIEQIQRVARAGCLGVERVRRADLHVERRAVFVRLMSRPEGDAALARRTIDGVVELMEEQPDLNEFKYTTLSQ